VQNSYLVKSISYESNCVSPIWVGLVALKRLLQLILIGQPFTQMEIAQILKVFQANMLAMSQYVPSKVYPHPITLFRAKEIHPNDDFLPDEATSLKDPTWGWNKLSTQPLNFHIVPGNHFTMMMEPHVGSLAQQLRVYLEPI
jgi:thioesterase domain-containing protein